MSVHLIHEQVHGYGPEPRAVAVSFAPNGASNPVLTSNFGPRGVRAFTTTYAPTGQFSIQFHPDFAPLAQARFLVSAQCADLASWFAVVQIGAYNAATRTLVLQTHRAGTGYAPAADPGNRIHIAILFNDSTGA